MYVLLYKSIIEIDIFDRQANAFEEYIIAWFFIFNNKPYSSVLLALAISYNFLEI